MESVTKSFLQSRSASTVVRCLAIVALICVGAFFYFLNTYESSDAILRDARRAFQRGQWQIAEQLARRVLARDPSQADCLWIAGRSCAEDKRFEEAIRDLSLITPDSALAQDARLIVADMFHWRLCRFDDAEKSYRSVRDADPENLQATKGLAQLLAVSGRRLEAVPCILSLVKNRQASDLLMVLARESGAIRDEQLLLRAVEADPSSFGPWLGLARMAESRMQIDEAIELCRQAIKCSPQSAAPQAAMGSFLLAKGNMEDLSQWANQIPREILLDGEIQKSIGFLELHLGHRANALSAFLSAAKTLPDSRVVCFQISQLLYAAGDSKAAEVYVAQLERIRVLQEAQDQVLFSEKDPGAELFIKLIEAYEACGRYIEAYGWAQLALAQFSPLKTLVQKSETLAVKSASLDLNLISDADNPAFRIASSNYSFPDSVESGVAASSEGSFTSSPRAQVSFSESTDDILRFQYNNGASQGSKKMYEFTGGGVGVIDLDLDGYPDLAFSQGGRWEDRGTDENQRDAIFRNVRGMRFEEVSNKAQFGSSEYGQGLAIGDLDQDGFPDVLIVGVGASRLWRNMGDGTFLDQGSCSTDRSPDYWITSCAIADLNQDSLPDIYLVGYLSGRDVFERTCNDAGTPAVCLPTIFPAAHDELLLNDSAGGFRNASKSLPADVTHGKGLGILVFDSSGKGRQSIFVANDTTPNFLLSVDRESQAWIDSAFSSGLAVSALGKSEGSMGIAAGDPNFDGAMDLVVTNFLHESHAYYENQGDGMSFRDERTRSGLEESSLAMLGFGTQFLDADLDGELELFVANGHVDDLTGQGKPYKMPAQVFAFQQGRFTLMPPERLGTYFRRNHLGRAVARTDWNADGLPDLVVGNLAEPSVVLTNSSKLHGNSLRVRLIATQSNREAVYSTLTCRIKSKRQTQQIMAGDGYQCSNDKQLIFGCGAETVVDEVHIRWASGLEFSQSNVVLNSEWCFVEGRNSAYRIPR